MSLTPATFGFDLNNREIATLIYFFVLAGCRNVWEARTASRACCGACILFSKVAINLGAHDSLHRRLCLVARVVETMGLAQSQVDTAVVVDGWFHSRF